MMKPKVCILATCRNPELIRATTLVFDTIRVGFPTAEIDVYFNELSGCKFKVAEAAARAGARSFPLAPTIHHEWIQLLVDAKDQPFWLCDTDISFWQSMEQWDFKGHALAGRLIPAFFDDFTNCVTHQRLHTSMLYIDPEEVKRRLAIYRQAFPRSNGAMASALGNITANLFYPLHVPPHEFFDTCCLLYRAIGGLSFNDEQNDCFDHLHSGTISDLVGPHLNDGGMQKRHAAMMEKPELMRGIWRAQNEYFHAHAA